jgi:hypothetical protein
VLLGELREMTEQQRGEPADVPPVVHLEGVACRRPSPPCGFSAERDVELPDVVGVPRS